MRQYIAWILTGLLAASGLLSLPKMSLAQKGQWTQKADLFIPRSGASTSGVLGKIYAIGGFNAGFPRTVEAYDPQTDIWTRKANLPTPRSALATAVVNGKIYAIGGNVIINLRPTVLSIVEEYDPATNTWTRKADMPAPRRSHTTAMVGGKIYVIGGYDDENVLSTVEAYDPAVDTWVKKADMPMANMGFSVEVVNEKIYAIGGWAGAPGRMKAQKTVFEYDPVADTWTKKARMPIARTYLTTAMVNGKIYAIGGLQDVRNHFLVPVGFSTVEAYDPSRN